MKKNKTLANLESQYESKQLLWKTRIRLEQNKWKRFWKWVWYYLAFPFVWLYWNIRDFRTAIIFVIVFLVVSVEVWLPYLLALIFWGNEPFRITMLSVASACWIFWLGPGTPFLPLCIGITIGVKAIFNKIKHKKHHESNERVEVE